MEGRSKTESCNLNNQGKSNGILFLLDLKSKIDKKVIISLHESPISLTVSTDESGIIEQIRFQLYFHPEQLLFVTILLLIFSRS